MSYRSPAVYSDLIPTDERKGYYSGLPTSTPKYRAAGIDNTPSPTTARLLVPFSSNAAADKFVATFRDAEAKRIARVLATTNPAVGYIDFFLVNADESMSEKVQINETLADNFVAYFFGTKAPVFQYTGALLNTYQDDWRAAMDILYMAIGRGTALAAHGVSITLAYDNRYVSGAMVGMRQNLTGQRETSADFNFSILVSKVLLRRLPGTQSNAVTDPETSGVIKPSELIVRRGAPIYQRDVRAVIGGKYVTTEPQGNSAPAKKNYSAWEDEGRSVITKKEDERVKNVYNSEKQALPDNYDVLIMI